jgi:hypothetical protein
MCETRFEPEPPEYEARLGYCLLDREFRSLTHAVLVNKLLCYTVVDMETYEVLIMSILHCILYLLWGDCI